MAASIASGKGLPPEVLGVVAGVLEGPYGGLATGTLWGRRLGWKEALFSTLGWMGLGMTGGNLPLALWAGQGAVSLWQKRGWWTVAAVLAFLLSGLLFKGLWLAPLGVVLAQRTGWTRVLGQALTGWAVYGPPGLLVPLGAWVVDRAEWSGPGGTTFQGMDRPVLLYGFAALLKAMLWR